MVKMSPNYIFDMILVPKLICDPHISRYLDNKQFPKILVFPKFLDLKNKVKSKVY